jgi:FdhD protein
MTRRIDADGVAARRPDEVLVEEPLEIRLDETLVSTTMRTPGHDYELAVGFCHTEGLLAGAPVVEVRYCATGTAVETAFNVVSVDTGGVAPLPTARLGTTSSSCGLCGSQAIETLADRLAPLDAPELDPSALAKVVGSAAQQASRDQALFGRTGGSHAAAAFDLASGDVVVLREDVGRHNAVDKVVGRLLLDHALPAVGLGLWISGRASFEMVQKAWAAGIPLVASVSAASALAVETAREAGVVVVGFARDGRVVVYE